MSLKIECLCDSWEQGWDGGLKTKVITLSRGEDRLCVQTPRLESNTGIDQPGLTGLIIRVPVYSQNTDRLDLSSFHFQVGPEDTQTRTSELKESL